MHIRIAKARYHPLILSLSTFQPSQPQIPLQLDNRLTLFYEPKGKQLLLIFEDATIGACNRIDSAGPLLRYSLYRMLQLKVGP